MKKAIFSLFLLVFVSFYGFAQGNNPQSNLPVFSWDKMTHNFGKITQGKPVTATFKFKNTGKSPIVITNARGSCGCTGVNYPKEPIAPNETAEISATFNAAAVGPFNKTVTVDANTENPQTILNIQGEVVEGKTNQ